MLIAESATSQNGLFQTVLIGITCSLIGSFLYNPLQKFFARYSEGVRSFREKREAVYQRQVRNAAHDDVTMVLLANSLNRCVVYFFGSAIFSFFAVSPIRASVDLLSDIMAVAFGAMACVSGFLIYAYDRRLNDATKLRDARLVAEQDLAEGYEIVPDTRDGIEEEQLNRLHRPENRAR